jgi:hypothetical protein
MGCRSDDGSHILVFTNHLEGVIAEITARSPVVGIDQASPSSLVRRGKLVMTLSEFSHTRHSHGKVTSLVESSNAAR